MGEDGAALSRQAERSGAYGERQPDVSGGGAVDCSHRQLGDIQLVGSPMNLVPLLYNLFAPRRGFPQLRNHPRFDLARERLRLPPGP